MSLAITFWILLKNHNNCFKDNNYQYQWLFHKIILVFEDHMRKIFHIFLHLKMVNFMDDITWILLFFLHKWYLQYIDWSWSHIMRFLHIFKDFIFGNYVFSMKDGSNFDDKLESIWYPMIYLPFAFNDIWFWSNMKIIL